MMNENKVQVAQPMPVQRKDNTGAICAGSFCAICCACIVVLVALVAVVGTVVGIAVSNLEEVIDDLFVPTAAPTNSPTVEGQLPLFPDEFLANEGDFVGLFFFEQLDEAVANAFTDAAARWSAIVEGSQFGQVEIPADFDPCDEGIIHPNDIITDRLSIYVFVDEIDGPGNILGQAGPCIILEPPENPFPVFGIMFFDIDDLDEVVLAGEIDVLILHEMGHVLGIGTLWETLGLIQDPVFTFVGNEIIFNENAVPGHTGATAIAEFEALSGNDEDFVPVEDGVFQGVETFGPRADLNGLGSIDGHLDEDTFFGAMMGPRLVDANAPLTRVTVAMLADAGYNVNFGLADDFELPSFPALRGSKSKVFNLAGDILRKPIKFLKPMDN